MALPESIRRAWMETDYRVRLPRGGYASIRFGEPLPATLLPMLRHTDDTWGYITAWNPAGVRHPLAENRAQQRALRDALQRNGYAYHAGIGVGITDWREASLFVPGIGFAELDVLARRFGQLGVVRGTGTGPAELHDLV
ncbi:MAG: DUF3293 domain-containing protein [Rhodanobacteraceae bacterium]